MIAISLGVQTFIFNPKEQKSFIPRRGCQKQRCVELKGGKKKEKNKPRRINGTVNYDSCSNTGWNLSYARSDQEVTSN